MIKQLSTTDREDEYFLNSCTSGLSMCCGHPPPRTFWHAKDETTGGGSLTQLYTVTQSYAVVMHSHNVR